MQNATTDTRSDSDLRFQGYRLEVIQSWPASPRKSAAAEAISQRLAWIARSANMRPDIEDLLHLSCRLLDDLFAADGAAAQRHSPDLESLGLGAGVP
jgi:hypothetical protein